MGRHPGDRRDRGIPGALRHRHAGLGAGVSRTGAAPGRPVYPVPVRPVLATHADGPGCGRSPCSPLLTFSRCDATPGIRSSSIVFAIGALVSLVASAAQQKEFRYHFYPSFALALVLLGMVVRDAGGSPRNWVRSVYRIVDGERTGNGRRGRAGAERGLGDAVEQGRGAGAPGADAAGGSRPWQPATASTSCPTTSARCIR